MSAFGGKADKYKRLSQLGFTSVLFPELGPGDDD